MSDAELIAELIARLRKADEYEPLGHDGWEAADRIEALTAEVSKVIKACSDLSQQHIAEWNRAEAAEAKLAKAVEALEYYAVEAMPWEADDSLIARATLAEIKGESHE